MSRMCNRFGLRYFEYECNVTTKPRLISATCEYLMRHEMPLRLFASSRDTVDKGINESARSRSSGVRAHDDVSNYRADLSAVRTCQTAGTGATKYHTRSEPVSMRWQPLFGSADVLLSFNAQYPSIPRVLSRSRSRFTEHFVPEPRDFMTTPRPFRSRYHVGNGRLRPQREREKDPREEDKRKCVSSAFGSVLWHFMR